MSADRLAVDHVVARHQGSTIEVLHDVSFSVGVSDVLAVLGSSGSGKTSLLRAIAGLLPVQSGRVLLDGEDITDMPTHRRGIGLMFQDHALFPHLSVADNVAFGLRMAKIPSIERTRRVGEVLALVGLDGFDRREVASLSGGERQRVALARTLAPSPRVLLLDEPMGSLDRVLRDRLLPELGDLIGRLGLTVLYVTHDRSEAFALADRIAVMDAGHVVQLATPAELESAPVSEHVARLLGLV